MAARPKAQSIVHVDNPRVTVTEWRFAPGAETAWHRHGHDYVIVPLTAGKLLIDDGKQQTHAELATGKSYFRQTGVEHNVINDNAFDIAFVEIELKAPGKG